MKKKVYITGDFCDDKYHHNCTAYAALSLAPAVEGCMDQYANNYDPSANVAGGVIIRVEVSSVLQINGGSWLVNFIGSLSVLMD